MAVAFDPDGNLLVLDDDLSLGLASVRRYDGQTGAFLGDLVAVGAEGLGRGSALMYVP